MNCFYFHFIVSSKVHEFHTRKRHGLTAPTGYLMVEGSHKMICGNATNSAMMRICANTCGITPKKISDSGRPVYRATTKAFSPTGGVTMPTSAVTITMTPNQTGSKPSDRTHGSTMGTVRLKIDRKSTPLNSSHK